MKRTATGWLALVMSIAPLASGAGAPQGPELDPGYYKCGSNWFQKTLANGEITYVVVNPPPGF
jgi:hypothetical protein